MRAAVEIRRLRPADVTGLAPLRRAALETAPLAFGASLDDDRGLSPDFLRTALADEDEQAIFGYFEGGALAGMVGVIRASKTKQRHTATIWGLYVSPRARNKGAGRGLIEAAIRHATGWGLDHVQLAVTETAEVARRVYEAAGFRAWGRQPRALHFDGRFVDELHLTLDLRPATARRDH
jgi:ribosomal protein S18 acetylase RimI-like enzyme